MAPLRAELNTLLGALPASRRPALRRASQSDALLATDLPLLVHPADTEAFRGAAEALGWRTRPQSGWLLLSKVPPPPEAPLPKPLPEGEIGCCLWLLAHHPGGQAEEETLFAVLKAGEAGTQALERLCAALHRDWAARLRQGQTLPGPVLPYLCAAVKERSGKT